MRLAVGVIVLRSASPSCSPSSSTSIDVLSGGRLIVGLGAGYLEAELRALGATLAERGARIDEYLAAMRALWDEPMPEFDGRFVVLRRRAPAPAPAQRPHPPIVLGGARARRRCRRAARAADGWFGWELSPEAAAGHVGALRRGDGDHRRCPTASSTPEAVRALRRRRRRTGSWSSPREHRRRDRGADRRDRRALRAQLAE